MKNQLHQHLIAIALAAIVTGLLLAMLLAVLPASSQLVAKGVAEQLDNASPEDVMLHLAQLEALQAEALPGLVQAMGSDRADVSHGARRLIDLELRRWQDLPPDVGSRHVEHLARLLAAHVAAYGPASREQARQLTVQILQWPMQVDVVDRTQFMVTCEIVLRAAGQVTPAVLVLAPPAGEIRTSAGGSVPVDQATSRGMPRSSARGIAGDQGGTSESASASQADAPAWSAEPPGLPATEPSVSPLAPPVAENRDFTDPLPQLEPPPWSLPDRSRRLDQQQPLATSRSHPSTDSGHPAPLAEPGTQGSSTPRGLPSPEAWADLEAIEVMRWLLNEAAAELAVKELVRRGFSDVQLLVARQIVDPDPSVRLQLAQMLPTIGGLEPRAWLLWLSRDADPAVRRATVAILATSPDPVLQDRLRALEAEETDVSVLRVVRRALTQRDRR